MNRWRRIQQSEEMGGIDKSLVCPKPRRICELSASCYDGEEPCDEKAGEEILGLFLTKNEQSSPPFFCGSPPSRVSNPVINDPRFGEDTPLHFMQMPASGSPMSPSASPARSGGSCVRIKFGLMPAAVRVEGFDRLGPNRRNRGITAVA